MRQELTILVEGSRILTIIPCLQADAVERWNITGVEWSDCEGHIVFSLYDRQQIANTRPQIPDTRKHPRVGEEETGGVSFVRAQRAVPQQP